MTYFCFLWVNCPDVLIYFVNLLTVHDSSVKQKDSKDNNQCMKSCQENKHKKLLDTS